jgi:uncharacterized protein (DUF169 family)
MNIEYRHHVAALWNKYFPGADLPLVLFYTDNKTPEQEKSEMRGDHCMISELKAAQEGDAVVLNATSIRCAGGRRYAGFSQTQRSDFRYFLSCGNEKTEGERYKKTPELVDEVVDYLPPFEAPAANLVCKRWDRVKEDENPEIVAFLSPPDVLSGLFTLANYDRPDMNGVICPFGSGCSSIIYQPMKEIDNAHPRAVLGMFDVSARPFTHPGILSFAMPLKRFKELVDNFEESFLSTKTWSKVSERLAGNHLEA